MRSHAWFGLGAFGLALVAAPVVEAGPPGGIDNSAPASSVQAAGHNHKGLFGWKHCVECQRAWVKKHDGVDVPPPPAILPAGVVQGQAIHQHMQGAPCVACEGGAVAIGPVSEMHGYPAGHATMGGPDLAGNYPAGHASVGDPLPVGVARAWQGPPADPRMAANGPRAASYDPSVMPTSAIPAQTAIGGAPAGRPHVIGHLLGIGGMTRHARQARADRKREAHASIAYDDPSQPVSELPASVVYGRGR